MAGLSSLVWANDFLHDAYEPGSMTRHMPHCIYRSSPILLP